MAKGGVLGNGIKVAFSENSPLVWTALADVLDAKIPTAKSDRVEITTHKRGNKLKRTMPGMAEVSDPTVTMLSDFDPATSPEFEKMRNFQASGVAVWWRFEFPTDRAQTKYRGVVFLGSVSDFAPAAPIADKQVTDWTIQFTGDDIYWDGAAGASQIS